MEAKIREIFSSIQGEGPFIGYKQIFIRFCGCNLKCAYCDTDFDYSNSMSYTPESLAEKIQNDYDLRKFHSLSLTGGEPLLHHEFLKEFIPLLQGKIAIYLETNATMDKELDSVIDYVDYVAADIKLKSSTGFDTFDLHEKFLKKCKDGCQTFVKVVFDENITDEEVEFCKKIYDKYLYDIILQPKMNGNKMCVSSQFCIDILDKFNEYYSIARLIPQTHKFIGVE